MILTQFTTALDLIALAVLSHRLSHQRFIASVNDGVTAEVDLLAIR